jgi:hypothetical protein
MNKSKYFPVYFLFVFVEERESFQFQSGMVEYEKTNSNPCEFCRLLIK